ncbi:MAG: Dam family site-specific DNA-(adenine-N6)-methyltransferase, partial [Phycisphaerales bacterium]|nr:Dam family site-specific DNA-(adenine-N6)-methyltransferase [Phycisphaerales bacterium]
MTNGASAFLKWAGGKQALARVIVGAFPRRYDRYIEPFLGGGSVFFAAKPREACLSDANGWLIDTYRAIRDDWRAVARHLDVMPNTKEDFLRYRAVPPTSVPPAERAALLIYLNKTCFRGLFRVNQRGEFNVPYGAYDRRYYDPALLAAVSASLQSAELEHCDFDTALSRAKSGDFVYLDPPYVKLGGYSDFNRYTREQFRESDQRRLGEVCHGLTSRGVLWLLSNSDTSLVREIYAGCQIHRIPA